MKNLYDTIEKNLKAGLQVVVQHLNDNYCCAIGTNKDNRGNYRYSGWCDSIKDAKQFIGSCSGYDKDYWNRHDLEIVEVFRPEYEPFKVGDKVRILDSIKKTEDWETMGGGFLDMTGEIEEFYVGADGTNYAINSYIIGHEYLAPLVEEVEDVALEAIKLLEEKGYRIIKK
ncbi:MAG: hypothetical protein PHU32_06220 [Candidatus ainarchaeum sp.]|nr:hypothetical protein [Candidatus ainarchaeum sp.]